MKATLQQNGNGSEPIKVSDFPLIVQSMNSGKIYLATVIESAWRETKEILFYRVGQDGLISSGSGGFGSTFRNSFPVSERGVLGQFSSIYKAYPCTLTFTQE